MANKKITELPNATLPITTGVKFEAVQGGQNVQVDANDMPGSGGGAVDSVNGQTGVVVLIAEDISFTPAGTISATDVQAAIEELDTEVSGALALKTDQLTTFRRLTGNHTLDSTDLASINAGDDLVIELNVAGANDLTIPLNATVAFPTGSKITIIQYGAGLTSVVATGGVTLNTSAGDALSRGQYAPMVLEKVATDEWYLYNGTTPGSIVSSGTWTPTLTNTTNIAGSTAYACQYLRVGNTVSFSGKFSLDSTSTGDTVMGMSLPIASAFSQEFHAGGVAASYAVQQCAAIFADATNDRLTIRLTITDTTNRDWFFSGSYQIL